MWIWIMVLVLMLGLLYFRSQHERHHFSVDTYTIQSEKIKEEKTLVFLSDLHGNCFGEKQRELLSAIDDIAPQAVLVGGDMIVAGKGKEKIETESALVLLKELAGKYPVYYGMGNHEDRMNRRRDRYGDVYDDYKAALENAGVIFTEGFVAQRLADNIEIQGLNLSRHYYRDFGSEEMEASYLEEELGRPDKTKFQILLAHSPMFFHAYADWGSDLTLSGHFHGGTIRIPGLGGLMTPQFRFFYPYCAGFFERDGKHMIVSRGLGTHSVNVRLNNRSQLVVIKLKNDRIYTGPNI